MSLMRIQTHSEALGDGRDAWDSPLGMAFVPAQCQGISLTPER